MNFWTVVTLKQDEFLTGSIGSDTWTGPSLFLPSFSLCALFPMILPAAATPTCDVSASYHPDHAHLINILKRAWRLTDATTATKRELQEYPINRTSINRICFCTHASTTGQQTWPHATFWPGRVAAANDSWMTQLRLDVDKTGDRTPSWEQILFAPPRLRKIPHQT